jgi:hypothetical protein
MPDKTLLSDKAIKELLSLYANGLKDRHDVQDETGLSFGEILQKLRAFGLTLPVVRTYDRYNEKQRAIYNELFGID